MTLYAPVQHVGFLVLDFTDAFWQLPIALAERKYFTARLRRGAKTLHVVCIREAQGSSNAPLMWESRRVAMSPQSVIV